MFGVVIRVARDLRAGAVRPQFGFERGSATSPTNAVPCPLIRFRGRAAVPA